MAHRSQCSSSGDNPLDPNYLPPHYREEYRLAVDALVEEDLEGYYQFLRKADVVAFLSAPEIQYIQEFVQVPQQSSHPDRFAETGGDGSSDTYWPIYSDLDAPGLDLGWPQLHHFIGPTEVTTLVNPPEPEMPSIKEQARRLIKNSQQVIAIAMDMFTDVDIFQDVLSAAMRNVAVYILLDESNAHHFVDMVSNCRVNLQSIQFLRVRTVSGMTYHCRSGKSFKGQMMDRFLLTDCRAVLSGNYSFMWSFEKLHRCMAHLFLGQLVSTFDEEFRILFAQSQPLMVEDMFAPMEDFSLLQKRQFPSERTPLYREPRKFLPTDTAHPEEWPRHSYDERLDMDWKTTPLSRKETLHGPADMYSRFPSHQSRMDLSFDQGPPRIPGMDSPYFKRHSYAEGVPGRYSYQFLQQQGMPEPENLQGRQFHRWQQAYPGPGKEADYSSYDKFWNKDYLVTDQYPEPGLHPEIESTDSFDPVVNYLSSTGNVDFDQGSDKLLPAEDLPHSSSFPRRLSLGQSYACQTSPTPSNPTDQRQFFLEPSTDRKDPMVKRGLRDWRISSYLSAYDNKGDEGLPLAPSNMPDPFEEPSNVIQHTTATPGLELSASKIPNVREFKVPAIPRASQMPSFLKITPREYPKNLPDDPTAVTAETKTTPATSESSSTTEGEKTEEAEQKEPKLSVFQREDTFRKKYNAGLQRSSRLRSSLIFGSLEQQHASQDTKTIPGQQDEESEKNESEQTKPLFVSQGLAQRRPTTREPFEWSRYMKSATFDNSTTDTSKPDDGDNKAEDKYPSKDEISKDLSGKCAVQEILKPPNVEQTNPSPSVPQPKSFEAELTKAVQPMKPHKSLLTTPMFVDMNDADMRLMFFKDLAAKRKAAMAAQAEKGKEKAQMKPPTEKDNTTISKEEPRPQQTVENRGATTTSEGLSEKSSAAEEAEKTFSTKACKSVSLSLEARDETVSQDGQVENDPNTNHGCKEAQTRISTDSEIIKLKNGQAAANMPVSAEPETLQRESQEQTKLSSPAVEDSNPTQPPTKEKATHENAPLAQGTDDDENPLIDSNESSLLVPSSEEVQPPAALDSNTQSPESVKVATSISHPPPSSEQHPDSELSSSRQSVKSPPSNESSLIVPSSEEVPPSVASDSNTKSPESVKVATSISHPPPSPEQHPESELISTNQSVKSPPSNESSLLVPSSEEVPPPAVLDSNTKSPESVNLAISISHPPLSPEQQPDSELSSSRQSVKSPPSNESSLLVPTSVEVPPSVASDSNTKSPESVKVATSISHPSPSSEQQPDSELSSSRQSVKSPPSNESSLLVPTSVEVPPSVASDSNTKSPESVKVATSISHPPLSPEQHPDSELSSSRQSVKSPPSNESSLLVPSSEEVQPPAALDSNTKSPESVKVATSISHPPPSPEQHPDSELSSTNQSVKSPPSNESSLLVRCSEEVQPATASDSNTQSPESVKSLTSISHPSPSSEQYPESEFSTSSQSVESASSLLIVPDSGSQISPKPSPSCSVPIPTEAETVSSEVILEDPSSPLTSNTLSPNEQDTISPSAQSVQETLEQPTAPASQTESECTQPLPDSNSQSSSESLSAVGPPREESYIPQDTCDAVSEPTTSSLQSAAKTDSEESSAHSGHYVPESENNSVPQASQEETEFLGSLENVEADSTPANPKHQSKPESCLPDVADLESKPRSDQNEVIIPTSSAADHPSDTSPADTNSLVHPDSATHASQSETITSQESPRQVTAPSELQPTGPVSPSSVERESCSPLTESVGSVLCHEAEPTLSALQPPSDAQGTTDSNKTPVLPPTGTCCPTEPTSKVPTEPESVTPETQPPEPTNGKTNGQSEASQDAEVPDTEEKKTDDTEAMDEVIESPFKEPACSEKTNDQVRQSNCPEPPEITSEEVVPTTPQTKQPKPSQSRYHASTANVLSSSNLRDDTKLLLEQISANNQSRSDAAKESPVTDDEKEGAADKNAQREKERGMRYLARGQPKSSQEREMLLERIQNMRKERKVYSRFEMAP